MTRALIALAVLAGCKGDDDTGRPPLPVETGDTGKPIKPIVAVCGPHPDNVLRLSCGVSFPEPAALDFRVEGPDGLSLSFNDAEQRTDHSVVAYGLHLDTTYTWTATAPGGEEESGEFTTAPALPPDVAFDVQTVGAGGPGPVLFRLSCAEPDVAVIIDEAGEPVWYQVAVAPTTPGLFLKALRWTPQGTILTMLERDRVVEWTLGGGFPLEVTGFDAPLHHDAARTADGMTFALFAELVTFEKQDYVVDGIYVIDPSGAIVQTWHLGDYLDVYSTPPDGMLDFWDYKWPGSIDFSHANALETAPDDSLVMSLRWADAVIKISRDGPGLGAPEWVVAANADGPIAGDMVADVPFNGQHHARLDPDGTLTMFDNASIGSMSRGVRYRLDPGAGTATQVDESVLTERCEVEGSNYTLPDGSSLVTCAPALASYVFDPGATDPRWTMTVSCDNGEAWDQRRVEPVPFTAGIERSQ